MNDEYEDDALADLPIQWIWAASAGLIVALIVIAVLP